MTYPLVVTFFSLAAATLALALGRAVIVRVKADDCLHLSDADVAIIEQQKVAARRLQKVDAWGKPLTVLTVLFGLAAYVVWWIGA